MSGRPSRARKAAIAQLSESQAGGLLALVQDNAADVTQMLDLGPADLEGGVGADKSAGHGVLVTRLREVMGVRAGWRPRTTHAHTHAHAHTHTPTCTHLPAPSVPRHHVQESGSLSVPAMPCSQVNNLNVEGLLARFFQVEALAAHCEERVGASGKGGVPVLAARIARAWAKPGFEPLAAAHAVHAAHAVAHAEAAAPPHAPAADGGATAGGGGGDAAPLPVSGAKRGGGDLVVEGEEAGAKCAKAGGPGTEEDVVRAAAAEAEGGGADGAGAEEVGAGGGEQGRGCGGEEERVQAAVVGESEGGGAEGGERGGGEEEELER
jgi:hypothetical protein